VSGEFNSLDIEELPDYIGHVLLLGAGNETSKGDMKVEWERQGKHTEF
jgi:hypothetical protein